MAQGRAGQGYPSKFTPATLKKLREGFELGMPKKRAARLAGISHQTLANWENDPEKGPKIAELIEEAEATAEMRWLRIIEEAALADTKNWTAAAWRLERKWPEEYGRRERTDMNHSGAVTVRTEIEYVNNWRETATVEETGE